MDQGSRSPQMNSVDSEEDLLKKEFDSNFPQKSRDSLIKRRTLHVKKRSQSDCRDSQICYLNRSFDDSTIHSGRYSALESKSPNEYKQNYSVIVSTSNTQSDSKPCSITSDVFDLDNVIGYRFNRDLSSIGQLRRRKSVENMHDKMKRVNEKLKRYDLNIQTQKIAKNINNNNEKKENTQNKKFFENESSLKNKKHVSMI